MTRRLQTSDQSLVNLLEIWLHIAEDDPSAADRMVDKITEGMGLLLSMPGAGRKRDDLRTGLYSYTVRPYLIFYRLSETHVIISRIFHGSRDLETLFVDEVYDTFRMSNEG